MSATRHARSDTTASTSIDLTLPANSLPSQLRRDPTAPNAGPRQPARLAAHGWLGLILIGISWPLNWQLLGPLTEWAFFPLWLGYILIVDAIVLRREGTSLLTRHKSAFAILFLISVPLWWLFEWFNQYIQNWEYLGSAKYTWWQYALLSSLNFSVVVPAVFESTELVASLRLVEHARGWLRVPASRPWLAAYIALGCLLFLGVLTAPRAFFPATWLCVFLIIDPINYAAGRPSLLAAGRSGDWRPVVALGGGALLTGWFWEMWNFFAMPKWIYHIPVFEQLHVWEMPLLGYGGYIPFGFELFAAYHLIAPALPYSPMAALGPRLAPACRPGIP